MNEIAGKETFVPEPT